jgi:serine/threonine-protein kinase NIM1
MERLHHPNIIRLYEVVETLTKLHIVMECATGGELLVRVSRAGRLQEEDAKPIFAQIVAAVQHMHEKEIVHRDLKAENIMFSADGVVKVGDFGFSITANYQDHLSTSCGSPPYAAPELFQEESYIGFPVDVWACGVILYFMVTGGMPFLADTVGKMKRSILSGVYKIPNYLSQDCQLVINSILQCDPKKRATTSQIMKENWLSNETFPDALPPYALSPHEGLKDDDSMEVHALLADYGITDEHLEESKANSRSSVTGTYRIVLHQVHKKSSVVAQPPSTQLAGGDHDMPVIADDKSHKKQKGTNERRTRIPFSITTKVCTIL